MELALTFREVLGHKRWLAAGFVVSFAVAIFSVYQIRLLPPKLTQRALQYSTASTQAYLDAPQSFVANLQQDITTSINRATIFANLMASPGALGLIGQDSGVPGDQIWAAGPVDPTQQRVVVEPTATKRNYEVSGESQPYRIDFLADPNLPIISIFAQAPTTAQADALANGSVKALRQYVEQLQTSEHTPTLARVTVRAIGSASGGIVNGGIAKKLAALVFLAVFAAWCVLILIATRMRANWRASAVVSTAMAAMNGHSRVHPRLRAPTGPSDERTSGAGTGAL